MQGIRDAKNNPGDYGIEGKDDGMTLETEEHHHFLDGITRGGDKITRYVWGGIEDQRTSVSDPTVNQ